MCAFFFLIELEFAKKTTKIDEYVVEMNAEPSLDNNEKSHHGNVGKHRGREGKTSVAIAWPEGWKVKVSDGQKNIEQKKERELEAGAIGKCGGAFFLKQDSNQRKTAIAPA